MKTFNVRMMAFHEPTVVRKVEVPDHKCYDTDSTLNAIYYYGQNDFQPNPNICSVSMGDVIELEDKLYLVKMIGFKEMTQEEFAEYEKSPRRDRVLLQYKDKIKE